MPWKLRVFPIVFEFFRGEGQALAAQAVAFLAPLAWISGDGQEGNVVKETDRKNKELFLGVNIFYFCGSKLANLEAKKKFEANTKTSEGIFGEDTKKGQRKNSSAPIRLAPLMSTTEARTAYHSGISCDGGCPSIPWKTPLPSHGYVGVIGADVCEAPNRHEQASYKWNPRFWLWSCIHLFDLSAISSTLWFSSQILVLSWS